MPLCECGCRAATGRGQFLPGHDQRLRAALETEVGGILALRSLVEASRAYVEGATTEQTLAQAIRAIYFDARTRQPREESMKTCREEVLEAARAVMQSSGLDHFTIPEVLSHMSRNGTRYADSTIRTHIVSRMCANAPENHAVTYRDFMRTDRGEYQFLNP